MSTDPESSNSTNRGGGTDLNAQGDVNVGGDVVGRDKIVQANTYIEHATFIQSGTSAQEIEPVVETSTPSMDVSRPHGEPVTPGEAWLSDANNRRVIGGMEFVRVPAGKFIMGSDHTKDEKPQHPVAIRYDYWIGQYPVTNGQFAIFMKSKPLKLFEEKWQKKPHHPAVGVSWRDAMAYCRWLNQLFRDELKKLIVRLPTEAEWEKAARGTDGRIWPWGNEPPDETRCNFNENVEDTTQVGQYSPYGDSPYGCADMAGNVWEWCYSLFQPYPYKAQDGRENERMLGKWVARGGSWRDEQDLVRCACRNSDFADIHLEDHGFRCVLSRDSRR